MSIRRCHEVFTAPLEDTLLMMSVTRAMYYGLNGVGARIWELLERPTTEAALVEQLVREYEVDAVACAAEVSAFVAALRERGLLIDDAWPDRPCD